MPETVPGNESPRGANHIQEDAVKQHCHKMDLVRFSPVRCVSQCMGDVESPENSPESHLLKQ